MEPNGEADNRAGSGMLLAWIAAAENRGMPPVRKLENPELRFRVHQPETENMLVEMRQFTAAACSRAVPPKASDLHASAAAVKAVPASLPGTSSAARRGCPPTPRATELAHLRAPATLAEADSRRSHLTSTPTMRGGCSGWASRRRWRQRRSRSRARPDGRGGGRVAGGRAGRLL